MKHTLKWLEVSVPVALDDIEKVAGVMGQFGQGGAVAQEEVDSVTDEKSFAVTIYLPQDGELKVKLARLTQALESIDVSKPIRIRKRFIEPHDWLDVWKQYFKPFEIGKKFVVKPSWESGHPFRRDKIVIELDPGMAFGTGLHPTTRLCLIRLEKHIKPGMSVLDLGTGSGILAIAAAKLGAESVLALDTDPVAVKAAKINVKVNHVENVVAVEKGTVETKESKNLGHSFDLVVANITADVISGLADDLKLALSPSGTLIAGGINEEGLDKVLIKLAVAGLKIEAIDRAEGWHTVVARD